MGLLEAPWDAFWPGLGRLGSLWFFVSSLAVLTGTGGMGHRAQVDMRSTCV